MAILAFVLYMSVGVAGAVLSVALRENKWVVGLGLSLGWGSLASWVASMLLAIPFGHICFPFDNARLETKYHASQDILTGPITGLLERAFFTFLIAIGLTGIPAALLIWLTAKGYLHYYEFRNDPPTTADEEEKRSELIWRGFRGVLVSLVSLAFAAWGGRVCLTGQLFP